MFTLDIIIIIHLRLLKNLYLSYLLLFRIGYGQTMKNLSKKEEDWSRNLVSDMENLLDSGTLTDVAIKCDKKTIKCHKAVLSARSAVFRAMFNHDMRENKHNEILITVTRTHILVFTY